MSFKTNAYSETLSMYYEGFMNVHREHHGLWLLTNVFETFCNNLIWCSFLNFHLASDDKHGHLVWKCNPPFIFIAWLHHARVIQCTGVQITMHRIVLFTVLKNGLCHFWQFHINFRPRKAELKWTFLNFSRLVVGEDGPRRRWWML